MITRIVTRNGTKEYCEAFLSEIQGMGYTVSSYALQPLLDNDWSIIISYDDPETLTDTE